MQGRLELLVLLIEGVLAVGQGHVTLQEKGMGRIADDGVVGILPALGGNGFRVNESSGSTGRRRCQYRADRQSLSGDDIRPE